MVPLGNICLIKLVQPGFNSRAEYIFCTIDRLYGDNVWLTSRYTASITNTGANKLRNSHWPGRLQHEVLSMLRVTHPQIVLASTGLRGVPADYVGINSRQQSS